jgi:hypothetical protein
MSQLFSKKKVQEVKRRAEICIFPQPHIVVSRNSIPLDMLSRTPMASLGEPER